MCECVLLMIYCVMLYVVCVIVCGVHVFKLFVRVVCGLLRCCTVCDLFACFVVCLCGFGLLYVCVYWLKLIV